MNKIINFYLILVVLLTFSSCIKGTKKVQEKIIKNEIQNKTDNDLRKKNVINYSKVKISKDSLDIALFNLISKSDSYSKKELFENIESLIKQGAKPNASVEYSYSYRKLGSYIPIVKAFYRNKYRNVTDVSTPFNVAVNSRKTYIVKKLIELGANTNISSKNKIFPIDIALKNNDVPMVNTLLANKCKVENANLSVCNDIKLLEKMVKLGANPKTIDINFALSDKQILKRILDLNVDINTQKLNYRKVFSNEQILDLLLKYGLNNSVKGKFPNTDEPLIYGAIEYGDLNTIKKLKNAGINIMQKKKSASIYISPIIDIVKSGKTEILKYYIENGANVNEKDWTGRSVLHFAIDKNNDTIIKILIDAGANKEYTGYFNKTPLMYAAQMNKYISAQVLINQGVNLNYKNKYNDTALSIAINSKNFPMIKLFVENGANIQQKYGKMNMAEYAKSVNAQDIIIRYLEEQMNN